MPATKGQKYNIEPKDRLKALFDKVVENRGNIPMGKAMVEIGYAPATAHNPQNVTKLPAWQKLLNESLPDKLLTETHLSLLKSQRLDHMIFPLGPKGEDDINLSGGKTISEEDGEEEDEESEEQEEKAERTTLTDEEIKKMLLEVNCHVRRIVHGETARHVYFWSPDNKARQAALETAYEIKDKYPAKESGNKTAIQINMGGQVDTDRQVYD